MMSKLCSFFYLLAAGRNFGAVKHVSVIDYVIELLTQKKTRFIVNFCATTKTVHFCHVVDHFCHKKWNQNGNAAQNCRFWKIHKSTATAFIALKIDCKESSCRFKYFPESTIFSCIFSLTSFFVTKMTVKHILIASMLRYVYLALDY